MPTRTELDVDRAVATELYPLAVKQARAQVLIQVGVLAAFCAFLLALGMPRRLAWTTGLLATGAIATAYDVRWWVWLRRADPLDAYRRLQSRSDSEGGRFRRWLTLIVSLAAFLGWLLLAR